MLRGPRRHQADFDTLGNTQVHDVGALCQTPTDTVAGEVHSEGCEKTNFVYHEKAGGEEQILHSNGKSKV